MTAFWGRVLLLVSPWTGDRPKNGPGALSTQKKHLDLKWFRAASFSESFSDRQGQVFRFWRFSLWSGFDQRDWNRLFSMLCLAKRLQLMPISEKFQSMPCFSGFGHRLWIRQVSLYCPACKIATKMCSMSSHIVGLRHCSSTHIKPNPHCPQYEAIRTLHSQADHGWPKNRMHCAPCCIVSSGGNGTFGQVTEGVEERVEGSGT